MANQFGRWIKKKVLGREQNLVSLDNPFKIMEILLQKVSVAGILDAGASDGRISQRLLQKFPHARSYAFEPNLFYQETLQKYAAEEPRFLPQYFALSDREGSALLHMTHSAGHTSLFRTGSRFEDVAPSDAHVNLEKEVPMVTIDAWAGRNGDPEIQLMKFDIQGAELKALQGGRRVLERSACLVYAEIWFNTLYEGGAVFSEVDQWLRNHGFFLFDLYKPKYNRKHLLQWANAIFVHAERLGF